MTRRTLGALLNVSLFVVVLSMPHVASAETVIVKYRGEVDLKPFKCETVYQSSAVKRLCYDAKEEYVVVNLNGIYYQYCEVPAYIVSGWRASNSTGDYFNKNIRGHFDCRVNRVPAYR
jgi:KTSC domain